MEERLSGGIMMSPPFYLGVPEKCTWSRGLKKLLLVGPRSENRHTHLIAVAVGSGVVLHGLEPGGEPGYREGDRHHKG